MTRTRAVVACAWLAAAGVAAADGRAPSTSTIHFQRGAEQNIAAGMTFGLLLSHDNGSSWEWMCEDAVGYGGTYDPSYSYTPSGAVFATTFNGLAVMRDGCSFNLVTGTTCSSSSHCTFVSVDTTDGSGNFYYGAADPMDACIYKSSDDGSSFPQKACPGQDNDWWESLDVAPSDDTRLYLTGYRTSNTAPKLFLLFSSTDGGSSFLPMAGGSAISTIDSSIIDIASVDPNDPNTMYVTVSPQSIMQVQGDGGLVEHAIFGLWRTTDGGATFTQVLTEPDYQIYAVARHDGDLVAASQGNGVLVSHDQGSSWSQPIAGAPHVNCITENGSGQIWACTLNYGTQLLPSDGAGIMTTTDLTTWTKALAFENMAGPVSCAGATVQQSVCVEQNWCTLKQTLAVETSTVDCAPPTDASPLAAPPLSSTGGGCCDSSGGPGVVAFASVVAMIVLRRRSPARTC
jgi:hypothetical protein